MYFVFVSLVWRPICAAACSTRSRNSCACSMLSDMSAKPSAKSASVRMPARYLLCWYISLEYLKRFVAVYHMPVGLPYVFHGVLSRKLSENQQEADSFKISANMP